MMSSNMDKEFATLEKLAFVGRWDPGEHKRIWNMYELDLLMEQGLATNDVHDRLSKLIAMNTTIEGSRDMPVLKPLAVEFVNSYLEMYPSSFENLPELVKCKIEAREHPAHRATEAFYFA